ncbi:MAG: hypothetical protein FWC93_06675, partial [Defluviitaleaceae bacterium]|nr:hypothetical protein [Defluviitaleaceae bacterium]
MSQIRKHFRAFVAFVLTLTFVLSSSVFAFAYEPGLDEVNEVQAYENTYDYEGYEEVELIASTDSATLVSPPSFMDYAVFDMLDLRGIEIQVG